MGYKSPLNPYSQYLNKSWKWNGVATIEYRIVDMQALAGDKVLHYIVHLGEKFDDVELMAQPADWNVTNNGQLIPLSLLADGGDTLNITDRMDAGKKRSAISAQARDVVVKLSLKCAAPRDNLMRLE